MNGWMTYDPCFECCMLSNGWMVALQRVLTLKTSLYKCKYICICELPSFVWLSLGASAHFRTFYLTSQICIDFIIRFPNEFSSTNCNIILKNYAVNYSPYPLYSPYFSLSDLSQLPDLRRSSQKTDFTQKNRSRWK